MIALAGNVTLPAMWPVVAPSQIPLSEIGKFTVEFAVSACVVLLHVLPATATPDAVIVQTPPIEMTALPFVMSTAVVLVAVPVQLAEDVTDVDRNGEMLLLQLSHTGPAAVPDALTVFATSLPVDRTFTVAVHDTVEPLFVVSV